MEINNIQQRFLSAKSCEGREINTFEWFSGNIRDKEVSRWCGFGEVQLVH